MKTMKSKNGIEYRTGRRAGVYQAITKRFPLSQPKTLGKSSAALLACGHASIEYGDAKKETMWCSLCTRAKLEKEKAERAVKAKAKQEPPRKQAKKAAAAPAVDMSAIESMLERIIERKLEALTSPAKHMPPPLMNGAGHHEESEA